jgi:hypothetical protein
VQSVESQPTFRKNMCLHFGVEQKAKQETSVKKATKPCRLTFNELLGVISQKTELFHNHRCENLKSNEICIIYD